MIKLDPTVHMGPDWEMASTGFELSLRALGRSPRTIRGRLSSLSVMARWMTAGGAERPQDVTRSLVRRYLVTSYEGRVGTGTEHVYQSAKAFWSWWAAEEELPNPFDGMPRPKCKPRVTPVLRVPQVDAVLAACKGSTKEQTLRDTAIVWLLLESGLRRAELCALNVADVDVTGHTVSVLHGKGGKARISVFGADTARALWRWLRVRDSMPMARRTDALFLSKFGRLSLTGCAHVLTTVGERAGVPLHAHQFRHTAAHTLLKAGAAEGDLMMTFGWSTRRMLDVYGGELRQERAVAAALAMPVGKLMHDAKREGK